MNQNRFDNIEHMLTQGADSRYKKASKALDAADDLFPGSSFEGSSAELREILKHLQTASENISELLVYRKIIGLD